VSASAGYTLRAVCVPGNGSIEYYINGTLVATISTNMPSTATAMGINLMVSTLTALARLIRVGRVTMQHEG
jgi:hypothetical protein